MLSDPFVCITQTKLVLLAHIQLNMIILKLSQNKSVFCLSGKRSLRTWTQKRLYSQAVKPAEIKPELSDAKSTVAGVKGIAYKNLTIGVPKEVWPNERRSVLIRNLYLYY